MHDFEYLDSVSGPLPSYVSVMYKFFIEDDEFLHIDYLLART